MLPNNCNENLKLPKKVENASTMNEIMTSDFHPNEELSDTEAGMWHYIYKEKAVIQRHLNKKDLNKVVMTKIRPLNIKHQSKTRSKILNPKFKPRSAKNEHGNLVEEAMISEYKRELIRKAKPPPSFAFQRILFAQGRQRNIIINKCWEKKKSFKINGVMRSNIETMRSITKDDSFIDCNLEDQKNLEIDDIDSALTRDTLESHSDIKEKYENVALPLQMEVSSSDENGALPLEMKVISSALTSDTPESCSDIRIKNEKQDSILDVKGSSSALTSVSLESCSDIKAQDKNVDFPLIDVKYENPVKFKKEKSISMEVKKDNIVDDRPLNIISNNQKEITNKMMNTIIKEDSTLNVELKTKNEITHKEKKVSILKDVPDIFEIDIINKIKSKKKKIGKDKTSSMPPMISKNEKKIDSDKKENDNTKDISTIETQFVKNRVKSKKNKSSRKKEVLDMDLKYKKLKKQYDSKQKCFSDEEWKHKKFFVCKEKLNLSRNHHASVDTVGLVKIKAKHKNTGTAKNHSSSMKLENRMKVKHKRKKPNEGKSTCPVDEFVKQNKCADKKLKTDNEKKDLLSSTKLEDSKIVECKLQNSSECNVFSNEIDLANLLEFEETKDTSNNSCTSSLSFASENHQEDKAENKKVQEINKKVNQIENNKKSVAKKNSKIPKKNKPTVVSDSHDVANPLFFIPFKYGWKRELVYRSAQSKRLGDIYYYTPKGRKCRSRNDVLKYIAEDQSGLSRSNFYFSPEPLNIKGELIRHAGNYGPREKQNKFDFINDENTPKAKKRLHSAKDTKKNNKIRKVDTSSFSETDKTDLSLKENTFDENLGIGNMSNAIISPIDDKHKLRDEEHVHEKTATPRSSHPNIEMGRTDNSGGGDVPEKSVNSKIFQKKYRIPNYMAEYKSSKLFNKSAQKISSENITQKSPEVYDAKRDINVNIDEVTLEKSCIDTVTENRMDSKKSCMETNCEVKDMNQLIDNYAVESEKSLQNQATSGSHLPDTASSARVLNDGNIEDYNLDTRSQTIEESVQDETLKEFPLKNEVSETEPNSTEFISKSNSTVEVIHSSTEQKCVQQRFEELHHGIDTSDMPKSIVLQDSSNLEYSKNDEETLKEPVKTAEEHFSLQNQADNPVSNCRELESQNDTNIESSENIAQDDLLSQTEMSNHFDVLNNDLGVSKPTPNTLLQEDQIPQTYFESQIYSTDSVPDVASTVEILSSEVPIKKPYFDNGEDSNSSDEIPYCAEIFNSTNEVLVEKAYGHTISNDENIKNKGEEMQQIPKTTNFLEMTSGAMSMGEFCIEDLQEQLKLSDNIGKESNQFGHSSFNPHISMASCALNAVSCYIEAEESLRKKQEHVADLIAILGDDDISDSNDTVEKTNQLQEEDWKQKQTLSQQSTSGGSIMVESSNKVYQGSPSSYDTEIPLSGMKRKIEDSPENHNNPLESQENDSKLYGFEISSNNKSSSLSNIIHITEQHKEEEIEHTSNAVDTLHKTYSHEDSINQDLLESKENSSSLTDSMIMELASNAVESANEIYSVISY